jgi:flagellar protein FliO/FliZ
METPTLLPSFLKMIFALSIVLGIMVAAAYFFRKFLGRSFSTGGDESTMINVIATRYLGPKSSIMLVDVLGELIVLGISNNQMSVLTTISDPGARQKIREPQTQQAPIMPSIMDQFMRYKDSLRSMRFAGREKQK